MAEKFKLVILTPYGRYFEGDVDFISVNSEKYSLGILPHHSPLISTLSVCKLTIRINDKDNYYAIGGGVINVEIEKTTLILNSIEKDSEIDLDRAKESKKRAEERLNSPKNGDEIDIARAKLSLLRAINRINIGSKD